MTGRGGVGKSDDDTGSGPGPIAQALQSIGEYYGITSGDVAREGGPSQSYSSRIWTGEKRNPAPPIQRKIRRALAKLGVEGKYLELFDTACSELRRIQNDAKGRSRGQGREPTPDELLRRQRIGVFRTQAQAYEWVIDYVKERKVVAATMVTFSCTSAYDLLATLLDRDASVTLYTASLWTAKALLTSGDQYERIRFTRSRIIGNLGHHLPRLTVWSYKVLAGGNGAWIQFESGEKLLLLGTYTYEEVRDEPGVSGSRNPMYPRDWMQLSGHDRYAIVAFDDAPQYRPLFASFNDTLSNLEHTARPLLLDAPADPTDEDPPNGWAIATGQWR